MKILLCHFSPTGNTAKVAQAIGQRLIELGNEVDELDMTDIAARQQPPDLSPYQAVLIGSPIHYMRAPRLVRQWLATWNGQGRKCATFFTFGGFFVHPAHLSAREILQSRGLTVVASAEFPGTHTYNMVGWKAVSGRPNDSDLAVAREFAEHCHRRFTGEDPNIVQDLPQGKHTSAELDAMDQAAPRRHPRLPSRQGKECQMCMLCEQTCPSGAMNATTGESEAGKCIICLRCMQICPDQIIEFIDLSPVFARKLAEDGESEESFRRKKSRLYL